MIESLENVHIYSANMQPATCWTDTHSQEHDQQIVKECEKELAWREQQNHAQKNELIIGGI